MSKINKKSLCIFIGFVVLCLPVFGLLGVGAGCSYFVPKNDEHFKKINIGDTIKAVIDEMGSPSFIETKGKSNPTESILSKRYGAKECKGSCVQRFVYEVRACFDLRAWVVEFDEGGVVSSKYIISSP